ncbi:PilZ domain-containing protein [Salinibius halmophilus]|uniref:PilZ domain-containing protein n=1 Tax=Salinibius halmophilus TaxID=1853216 RepID=UPI000E668D73|nr:PilZ domain-containing protein [Salinibius halmophilus]
MTERRLFSRVAYRAPAVITCHETTVTCQVIDMSLHGICTSKPEMDFAVDPSELVQISVNIPDSNIQLLMDAMLVSFDDSHLRFEIQQIDLESITYLKRMVELNIGDESLLHRELEHLSHIQAEDQ